jgi:ankyrin repeat protein
VQADAAAKNDHGETALDLALAGDCAEAVELLRAAAAFEQVHAAA